MAEDKEEIALYRRYRPTSFDEVQGQGEKVKALARAVASGKPHHAYLFTGPRGVGKTTTARLIAAGLNCEHGPTATPCGECYSCKSIASGQAMDVQEIDAASNNSVDDIRALRERTNVVAAFGSYRIFILDEVHMLSNSAWNALLKTLEEPPSHTIFILATTDVRKVPATVISRCQHVRFNAPTAAQIAERILEVATREDVVVEENAAKLLGRSARGSYRDALQHLQLAFGRVPEGEIISEAVVRGLLGTENEDLVFTAMRAAGAGDLTQTLAAAAKLGAEVDPEIALAELEQLAREVLICAAVGKIPPSLSTTPAHDDLIVLTSNHLHAQGAARLLDEIGNAMLAVRAGADPRVRLELALAKTADPSLSPVSEQTQRRLDRLEGAVASRTYSRRPT